ncbi:MAG: hypothetical protein ACKVVT_18145 [Dehalococcoidia bacterium]
MLAVALLAGCGGDDDEPVATPSPGGSPPTASTGTPAAALTPGGILPTMASFGFRRTEPEKVAAPGGLDIAFSIYERTTEPKVQARAEVRVYANEAAARADYPTQSEGWKTPPPDVFNTDLKNVSAPALGGMAEAVGYVATAVDQERNRVWTDVYRIGRVVVVQHVLGRQEADTNPIRLELSSQIRAQVR